MVAVKEVHLTANFLPKGGILQLFKDCPDNKNKYANYLYVYLINCMPNQ
jgi:hypothetical protein